MRYNTILEKRERGIGLNPLISHSSTVLSDKENEDFSCFDLSKSTKPVIWAHVDSWEESEILLPIIKVFAQERRYTILMTFSSSLSAKYYLQKGYDYIDLLFPLSIDIESNVEIFISFAKPTAVFFSISIYRYKVLHQLKKRFIPTFLFAAKIRKASHFFKWCDSSYRDSFKVFTHIFVFDNESKVFLDKFGISNVTVSRYLPVSGVWLKGKKHYHNFIIEKFIANEKFIFIGGNIGTDKDLKLVVHLANTNSTLKCILVPHTISEEHLNRIKYELKGFSLLYSECDEYTNFDKVQVLVIDFLGALPYIYRYGSCAYIGGGFTPYLHDIIGAIAHGLPVSFGPRIRHRILPKYLINLGVSQIVKTPVDICKWEKRLESNPTLVYRLNSDSMHFMERGFEATHRIYACINSFL